MKQIFLAPRSNETAYKNYISSMQGIPKESLDQYFTDQDREKLTKLETIHAWGCQPSQQSKWESMVYGDYIFFYAKGRFISVGELVFKKKSSELALALWPRNKETNEPWSCVFFVDRLFQIDLPLEKFNELTGYSLTAVMGFMPVKTGVEKLNQRFGDVEGFVDALKTGLEVDDVEKIESLSKSSLNARSLEDVAEFDRLTREQDDDRVESVLTKLAESASGTTPEKVSKLVSSYKRNRSLVKAMKEKYENKCQICDFTFLMANGNHYSEAAHIIPISSGKEGVDSPDNIWILCANHHKMLDTGALKSISATEYELNGETKKLLNA